MILHCFYFILYVLFIWFYVVSTWFNIVNTWFYRWFYMISFRFDLTQYCCQGICWKPMSSWNSCACFGGSDLRLLTKFPLNPQNPGNPPNPGMNSKTLRVSGGCTLPAFQASNIRNFSRTFEIVAWRSESRSDARSLGRKFRKMNMKNWNLEPKSGLPKFLVEAKFVFGIWILISRGQKYQIISKSSQR